MFYDSFLDKIQISKFICIMGRWVDSRSCVWRMLKGEYQAEWTRVLMGLNTGRLDDGHQPFEITVIYKSVRRSRLVQIKSS